MNNKEKWQHIKLDDYRFNRTTSIQVCVCVCVFVCAYVYLCVCVHFSAGAGILQCDRRKYAFTFSGK